jgi:hypothetical protein
MIALQITTSDGRHGNYSIPSPHSASHSQGTYQASSEDFVKSFYAVVRRWRVETAFISDPDKITAHPSFAALVQNADVAMPLIIEELIQQPSLLVWVLDDAFPSDRPYADSDVGDIEAMTNAWITWAERDGLRTV